MQKIIPVPYLLWLGLVLLLSSSKPTDPALVWQIGSADGRADEFALADGDYKAFLDHDFGWEDRYFLIGYHQESSDFPYVLPGPQDKWGGTSGTAGIRTHVINVLFAMEKLGSENQDWVLELDILGNSPDFPPYFKVTLNEQSWKKVLPKGSDSTALKGNPSRIGKHTVRIPLSSDAIRLGGNQLSLTTLEGSWLVFDQIRLLGDPKAKVSQSHQGVYLREVSAATYQLNDQQQAMIVDLEHLSGEPTVEVMVDGESVFQQLVDQGRHTLEIPIPAVSAPKESRYQVRANQRLIGEGTIERAPGPVRQPAGYVDTRMGAAHSRWMLAPGPWMPFSMVKLSPDNQNSGWQSGYDPSFESIGTFSHVHEWTMAGLGVMPTTGPLKTKIGDESVFKKDSLSYRSAIDKNTEEAGIGYYKVLLSDYNITAELTATTRAGFQRYTFHDSPKGRVLVDLKIPAEYEYDITESTITKVSDRRVEGYSKQVSKGVWSKESDQEYVLYFVLEFDQDIKSFGGWLNDQVLHQSEIRAEHPESLGYFLEFDTEETPVVQLRSALSYVDIDGARRNLEEEISKPFGWDFQAVKAKQQRVWNDLLGRVKITSDDRREKVRFYTNLYRSFLRNMFSDVDGRWVDATEQVRQFSDSQAVALGCDAFWNTFWNLNQVWNLVSPEWSSKWVKSQLGMYDANGWLAKGPAGMEYVPVMVGEHEIPLLVSAYQMGIRDYDSQKLFQAVKKMQTTPPERVGDGLAGNRDLEAYLNHGFVPADYGRFSNSLEYSFDDWTVGQLAKALDKQDDYELFNARGYWWKNAIDTATGYARMRYSNGDWEQDFDPFTSGGNRHYVEANAWQMTFFVPQNVPELAQMIGPDRFLERLDWGFKASEPLRYNAPGDQYWDYPVVQGNQQSMHFAFLFNWVGRPWETQKWSRSIIDRYYGHDLANAYLGDEDQGQMSAWFIMASLGLFQMDGGSRAEPIYEIGSPIFEHIMIDLGGRYGRGEQFEIIAKNTSRKNKYVQSARLNGKKLDTFWFPASELLKGGKLELLMGPEPNEHWGVDQTNFQ